MKKSMLIGVIFIILSAVPYFLGVINVIVTEDPYGMLISYGIAFILFVIGFLIILSVVLKERLQEIKKEKGKYKQYEEED